MLTEESTYNFNTIYTHYYQKSYAFVKSYVHDDMASEDIVSDSLICVWEYLKKNPVRSLDALLLTTLKNKSLDYLKHVSTSEKVKSTMTDNYQVELQFRISTLEECNTEVLYSKEIMNIYKKSLHELPVMTRKIFYMSRHQYLSNKEIALKMGITVKTVEYHITKTIKLLRVELKDYLPFLIFLW